MPRFASAALLGSIVLALLGMQCPARPPCQGNAPYERGDGSAADPFQICTVDQLVALSGNPSDWHLEFRLRADLDLDGVALVPIGRDAAAPFTGGFDGRGHVLENFRHQSTNRDHVGLFGYVEGGVVENLSLLGADIEAGDLTEDAGGFVGTLVGGLVEDCHFHGQVFGYEDVGGLVGHLVSGAIRRSSATTFGPVGSINYFQVEGHRRVGGLAGRSEGEIVESFSTGAVHGFEEVGGLVGNLASGAIRDSYARGSVWAGNRDQGGLIGRVTGFGAAVERSYSTGFVDAFGINVGGMVGAAPAFLDASTAFWDVPESGWSTSAAGTPAFDSAWLQDLDPLLENAGWDFAQTWAFSDFVGTNDGYPVLRWQALPDDLAPPVAAPISGVGPGDVAQVLVETHSRLKLRFVPGINQEEIFEPPIFIIPQYSKLGGVVGVDGGPATGVPALSNGLVEPLEFSAALDLSLSFTPTCPLSVPDCRQQVVIEFFNPFNDYTCLNEGSDCPTAPVPDGHPWNGTLLIETDDTQPIE